MILIYRERCEGMNVEQNNLINSCLTNALRNVLGDMNADRVMKYLGQEDVVKNGIVNVEKLEPALRNLFGQASSPVLHSLLIVQKKSVSKELR
jgi:hypothetical protein